MISAAKKAKYNANRRKKYHNDSEHRAKILKKQKERYDILSKDPEWMKKENDRNKAYRRHKYNTDPDWRKKERARSNKSKKDLYKRNKTKAIEYTGNIQCHGKDCLHIKHNEPIDLFNIDFHHVITENKTAEFSELFSNHKWSTCKEEIDNCAAIPLCRICHGREEHGK